MTCQKESVKLLRELLSVLRTITKNSSSQIPGGYKQTHGYSYVTFISQNNIYNEGNAREFYYIGKTYLCLLNSLKDGKILYQRYKGVGEQSIENVAERVGFKLPNVPK